MTTTYDVIVVGGGPAGSTMAHLLAKASVRVLVLEREVFPRFHIGESLLPGNEDVFKRLGVDLSGHPKHVLKTGAEFYDEPRGMGPAIYLFSDSLQPDRDHAWQVDRATFDHALLQGAARAGAVVHEGERVIEVELSDPARVQVRTSAGQYQGRYLVDASGQDALMAMSAGTRRRLDEFGRGCVYRHYDDLRPDIAAELASHGRVKVLFVEDGWLWAIPLGGGRLSLGVVTRRSGISNELLDEAIANSPELTRLSEGATPSGPHHKVGSFSFHNARPHGPRWCCVGDAACFLDPVFSSGVNLGMVGAEHAADVLLPALEAGREHDEHLMDEHARHMVDGYNVFGELIDAIYRGRLFPQLFFATEQDPALRRGLTSLLAGDVWRVEGNPMKDLLARSRRGRFALPDPV